MRKTLDIIGSGLFSLLGALRIAFLPDRLTRVRAPHPFPSNGRTDFIFAGDELVEASSVARRLFHRKRRTETDLSCLLSILARGFGTDLGRRVEALSPAGRLLLISPVGAGTLEVVAAAGRLRLTMTPDQSGSSAVDALWLEEVEAELTLLRGLAEDAPQPIWTVDDLGRLSWANSAYLALADKVRTPAVNPEKAAMVGVTWPLDPLFETSFDSAEGQCRPSRLSVVPASGGEPLWYDVATVRRGEGSLHFATDVGDLVRAETAREHFIQTLAKTFAHLRTGLAIFDRDWRLMLFNPALVDLTGLPVGFLSGQPSVQMVLDSLRQAELLPELRDDANWRDELAALRASAGGEYCKTWTLPSGQTYRVTGRPHPDGALAFLLEDISDDVGLTRRFRDEIDLGHAAIEALEEGVAVFAPSGSLSFANSAYANMWGIAAGEVGRDLHGEIARWAGLCPTPFPWTEKCQEGHDHGNRDALLIHNDGRKLAVRVAALSRGGTLARFRRLGMDGDPPDQGLPPKPVSVDLSSAPDRDLAVMER